MVVTCWDYRFCLIGRISKQDGTLDRNRHHLIIWNIMEPLL
uniref:Uncharacterized protein n=1 Tax=Arundo donax TaxID=35708 RepID=A0A0A9M004_ARUDO